MLILIANFYAKFLTIFICGVIIKKVDKAKFRI